MNYFNRETKDENIQYQSRKISLIIRNIKRTETFYLLSARIYQGELRFANFIINNPIEYTY